MEIEKLFVNTETFDEIVEDVKQRNLSRNNMPKLIVGTGLSIVYDIPGMSELAGYLEKEMNKSKDKSLKEMWDKHSDDIKNKGLEAGLANLTQDETKLVDAIKQMTARYVLEKEEALHKSILERNTGFSRLLEYLGSSVSVNKKLIDIMTPNYDRVIEIVCDKLNIEVITGFAGNVYCRFNRNLLKKPTEMHNCRKYAWVRLFKPHGSINWMNEDGKEYLTNDYNILHEKTDCIEIVAPGSSKYRASLINSMFSSMREEFNELLYSEENYSLFIFGYGFNDDHFDTPLFDNFQKNVLILSRDVKQEIRNKALERKNITIFYHEGENDYMIYKSRLYEIEVPLWDINQFADLFLG